MRRIFILLSLPILLGGCSFSKKTEKPTIQNVEIPAVEHEYFEVENFYINWEDILFQNTNPYYIYVYSTTCQHCQELKNWIIETALKRGDIFFVKATNKITIKNDVSSTIGQTSIENIAVLGFPSMLKINSKTVVKNVAGNSKIMNLLS